MALLNTHLRYDKLKEPFMGHALEDLLLRRESKYEFCGSYSFTTKEGYEEITYRDKTASEADREIDPWTGLGKNIRTYNEIKDELPTWEEIVAEHEDNLAEYAAYEGKRNRKYPSWQDQLDLLYKDIGNGLLGEDAKTSLFYTKIKEIKDANP